MPPKRRALATINVADVAETFGLATLSSLGAVHDDVAKTLQEAPVDSLRLVVCRRTGDAAICAAAWVVGRELRRQGFDCLVQFRSPGEDDGGLTDTLTFVPAQSCLGYVMTIAL